MAARTYILLALAFCGSISVISAQISGSATCFSPMDSTTIGSIVIWLDENNALTLGVAQQLNTDPVVCGTDIPLIEHTAGSPNNRVMTFTLPVTTPTLPCGVRPVGTAGQYTFDFVTKSLTQGYHSMDAQFSLTCDFGATFSPPVTQTLILKSVLATPTVTLLIPGMTMTLNWRTRGTATWTPVTAAFVDLTSELQIAITLDKASSAAKEFGVTTCTFTTVFGSETRTAKILDRLAADPAHICPTADGIALGFNATEHCFRYAFTNDTFTGESGAFDSFTLFRISRLQTVLTCTINYCISGCRTDDSNCTTNNGTRRKRSTEPQFNSTQLIAAFTLGAISASKVQAINADADTDKDVDTTCEPLSNMGYLIGLIVLTVLLVFAVAVAIFMFIGMSRLRDKDFPKA